MNSNTISKGILKAIAIIAVTLLFLYLFFKIQSIIIYILIAAVVSLIARPFIRLLKNKLKFPNTIAVIVAITFFIAIFIGLISMFIPLMVKQGENLSLLNLEQLQANIQNLVVQINDYFLVYNFDILDEIRNAELIKRLVVIPDILNSVVGTVGNLSIGLFSVIFISFFFMKDTTLLENSLFVFINEKSKPKLKNSLSSIKNLLSRYFLGLVIQITILFVIYTITLLVFGIQNAIVIAFLCALLNLIPYVGPLIGGLLMLILSMSSNLGCDFRSVILPTTIYVMIGYIIAQIIDNFLSQPLIFSNSVKSHPLEIFLVIMISGILFGVVGMIVAVPAYTATKVILKTFLSENAIVKLLTKDL